MGNSCSFNLYPYSRVKINMHEAQAYSEDKSTDSLLFFRIEASFGKVSL